MNELGLPSDLPLPNLSPDGVRVLAMLYAEPPSPVRHCFMSAIDHLRRAYGLLAIDPAMAIFRGITAEEEAATGLMRALVSLRYPRADELRPRDHVQKHAVTPFIRAVAAFRSRISLPGVAAVRIGFKEVDGTERIVTALLPDPPCGLVVEPVPPLNFSVREGDCGSAPTFQPWFRRAIERFGYTNIRSFLRSQANLRNRILYAGPQGYPVVRSIDPAYLPKQQRRVIAILIAALMIWPYQEHQPFVVDALDSFLDMVGRLRAGPSDERDQPPKGTTPTPPTDSHSMPSR